MQNEPIEVTLLVTGVFEKLNVPYLISGSLASTLYGMVRTTQDSDIVAEMRTEHIKIFISLLKAVFYIDEEMVTEAIQRNSSFNIKHRLEYLVACCRVVHHKYRQQKVISFTRS